ncbi:MAG: exo-alpha-sialidase, partial [Pedobacter sp.]|nr:exo-alpha-sialidase [Pedobacter sp.]
KSEDGGVNWTTPTDSSTGLLLAGEYHCAPTPVVEHNGRLWRAMEDAMGPVRGWGKMFGSFMMSAPMGINLLKASSWEKSNILRYDSTYLSGYFAGWLEGNAVIAPNGTMVNVLRTAYEHGGNEKAAIVDISDDGKIATFNSDTGFIDFPGGSKKFTIHFDKKTNLYYTLSNYIPEKNKADYIGNTRNVLALCTSPNLKTWTVKSIILEHPDKQKHGFQYVDWEFEGKDIIAVSRTAFDDKEGGAHNFHDANYLTFHRIRNFRKLVLPNQ